MNDARCTHDIKSRIAMAKAAVKKKRVFFTSKLDVNLRKKLVKCYILSIAFYGDETCTQEKANNLESFEMRCWRRKENIG
jgi:hypothetical protein